MTMPAILSHPAGRAFDQLAEGYDDLFTNSIIGRAQRDAVWRSVTRTFRPGSHILDLNCGTGEDALFLARRGMSVVACDASPGMISAAQRRRRREAPGSSVRFEVLPTEELAALCEQEAFDGVFSNFSGLNCVADLTKVARALFRAVKPGAPLLLCFSTRYCCWEALWFLTRAEFSKAFRRWKGKTIVRLGGIPVEVRYPTIRELRKVFSPGFRLRSCIGIGITVPPSYIEWWAKEHPGIIQFMQRVDWMICEWCGFRAIGDHVLLCFERCTE